MHICTICTYICCRLVATVYREMYTANMNIILLFTSLQSKAYITIKNMIQNYTREYIRKET